MREQHWQHVYETKDARQVSWFRPHLERSLELIERATGGDRSAAIIDVGGGASTLADDLVERGFGNITVMDISIRALELAQARMGAAAKAVRWVSGDVVRTEFAERSFDLWHDRAVFHFLTDAEDRNRYVKNVARSLRPDGHAIIATFGPEGPMKCSGLDVRRYDAASLLAEFGSAFRLVESSLEMHDTPFGTTQQFVYCHFIMEQ